MYAARTDPAMVENPPVIMAKSSDFVRIDKYGLTRSGLSVCGHTMFISVGSVDKHRATIRSYHSEENIASS